MILQFADCQLDLDRQTLTRDGQLVPVEPGVFALICLLAGNSDRVVGTDELIDEVWGGRIVSDSAISARIAAARKAVGDDGKRQAVIRTLAKRGLQMVAPVVPSGAPEPGPPQADAPAPHVRFTRNDHGQSIAYASSGDGPPVLRMGYTATSVEAEWHLSFERALIDAVSARHRLVRFDHSGLGLSQSDVGEIDFDHVVGDAKAAADAAELDRFAMLAESGVSLMAVRFAAQYPERLSKLVIVGGYVDGRLRRGLLQDADPLRAMIHEGWGQKTSGMPLAYQLSYFPEGPLETLQEMATAEQAAASEALMLAIRDRVNNDSIAEFLPRVQCPTLIIQARHNTVHPLTEAKKLAAGIPDAELVVLDTANHIPLPGNAVWQEYLDTLLEFLGR